MKKSSSKVLKRAAAMLSAGVLAAAMAAPAAWAEDIPGVGDGKSTYTGTPSEASPATADSNVHLIVLDDDSGNTSVISVTAPTDIYLAAKASGTDDQVVDFQTPSKSVARIANLGSNKAKVTGWTVSASSGLAKVQADTTGSKGFWKNGADQTKIQAGKITSSKVNDVEIGDAVANSFWLQANGNDIAVPSTDPSGNWTMNENSTGHVGDSIELELVGQIHTPTKAWYESNPVIDTVTWTFSAVN